MVKPQSTSYFCTIVSRLQLFYKYKDKAQGERKELRHPGSVSGALVEQSEFSQEHIQIYTEYHINWHKCIQNENITLK